MAASKRRAVTALVSGVHRGAVALVAIPLLVFGIPAAAGRALVNDDNLVQNYPLRVLVGQLLRQGHLPLWDAYLASGTPLLAGFNAGAAFPATWLFAILPAKVAWASDQVLVYAVAAIGMYVFFRLHSMLRGVAALAAAAFAFGGFMASQVTHIDLVTGAALVPWALVAVRQIATRPLGPGSWRWVFLLSGSAGLVILAGSPEAALDGAAAVAVYAIAVVWRNRQRWAGISFHLLVGLLGALLLGAAQLVPGLAFAAHSQRSAATYAFFSSGSMQPNLSILAVVPYLLGGQGRFGVPIYFGPINVNEVTSYVGILAVMAAFALLAPRWWRHPSAADYRPWYVVIGVGVVLSAGGFTPLGHLLSHLPVYGSQRLQSRNLLEVDLGLSVLFGSWLQRVCTPDERYALPPLRPPGRLYPGLSRFLPGIPALGVVAIVVAFLFWGNGLENHLGAVLTSPDLLPPMTPYLIVTVVLALVAGGFAVAYRRVPLHRRLRVFGLITIVDLALFTANGAIVAAAPTAVVDNTTPASAEVAAAVPPGSRDAIYNPILYDYPDYLRTGPADINILRRLPSVQGYGSLVDGSYQQATGSHDQATLYPQQLRGSTFDQLDMGLLVTREQYFLRRLAASGTHLAPPPSLSSTLAAPPPPRPLPPLGPGQQRTWYLGGSLLVSRVSIPLPPSVPGSRCGTTCPPISAKVGVMAADGHVSWGGDLKVDLHGTWTATFRRPVASFALVAQNSGSATLDPGVPSARSVEKGDVVLDGSLQDDVKPPHWEYEGNVGDLALFRNTRAMGRAWAETAGGRRDPRATVRVRATDLTGYESIEVRSDRPVTLVRSVAMTSGWQAVVRQADGGSAVTEPVRAVGLVQGASVPAGDHVVTFRYRPKTAGVGLALSGIAVLIALVAGVWWWFRARRRVAHDLGQRRADQAA